MDGRFGLRARRVDRFNVGQEPVTAARDCLDETRILCRVTERFANFIDRLVEAVVEIHDRPRPESAAQFVSAHQLSGALEQHGQNLERLLLQLEPQAMFHQLAGSKIDFENTEPQTPGWAVGPHGNPRLVLPNPRAKQAGDNWQGIIVFTEFSRAPRFQPETTGGPLRNGSRGGELQSDNRSEQQHADRPAVRCHGGDGECR